MNAVAACLPPKFYCDQKQKTGSLKRAHNDYEIIKINLLIE